MTTHLQLRETVRRKHRLDLYVQVRTRLRECMHALLPGRPFVVFGSLTHPGVFNDASDIDIALESLPADMSIYTLTALLEEDMGRPVDVVLLGESRLRDKIRAEGETWIA